MTDPLDKLLDQLHWTAVKRPRDPRGTLPFATHESVLEIDGHKLRVYQLDNGQRVIDANDAVAFFMGAAKPPAVLGTCDSIHCPDSEGRHEGVYREGKPHEQRDLCFGRWSPEGGWKP
jgi:hypothetical protein